MLHIENLHVKIGDREVLKGIDLHINTGETFILFGPNGSGKTSLLMTLMGLGDYAVTKGRIVFKGTDITYAPTYERARLGVGMSFQRPPTIHGLPVRHLVKMCGREREVPVERLARRVNFDQFLERDVNAGFSGGEINRITSYNVCYTKLLRNRPFSSKDVSRPSPPGSVSTLVITSYSIHYTKLYDLFPSPSSPPCCS